MLRALKVANFQAYVSVPPRYEAAGQDEHFPLVLFLHGAGESGPGGLSKLKIHGVPRMVAAYDGDDVAAAGDQSRDPVNMDCARLVAESAVTVSPQLDRSRHGYGWKPGSLSALVDEVETTWRIDRSRIYVTGISMGGYGTWRLAMHEPDRFAAIAPVCGGGEASRVKLLRDMPIWCFHGARDDIIPLSESEVLIDHLRTLKAPNVHFTVYEDLHHDSWTRAYNTPELWQWMFQQRVPEKAPAGA